jgi:hypothetical protein
MARNKKKDARTAPGTSTVDPQGSDAPGQAEASPHEVTREIARQVFDRVGVTRGRLAKEKTRGAQVRPPATNRNAGRRKS